MKLTDEIKREVWKQTVVQKKQENIKKIPYWQSAGNYILDNNELVQKWNIFVEKQVNDDFINGALLDETLQIMTMIKAGIPSSEIAQTIENIPGGLTIIDTYLGAFIHPEILFEIQSNLKSKSR